MKDFAYLGNLNDFKQQLYTLLKTKYNIVEWQQIISNKLLSKNIISEWIEYAQMQQNETIVGFLTSLSSRALERKNLTILYTMIDVNNSGNEKDIESENVKSSFISAKYLFENCDRQTLTQLSKVINNAILKQECQFDDSLLFLSKMINNDEFVNVLEQCTKDCLSRESKNVKKYLYFKNNLLYSKIWGTAVSVNEDKKTQDNEDNNDNSKEKNQLLFKKIENSVILKELRLQREYIRNEIIKEELNFVDSWNELKNRKFDSFNYHIDPKTKNKIKNKCQQIFLSDYS